MAVQAIELRIRFLDGSSESMALQPNTSIAELRERLCRSRGLKSHQLKLFQGSRELKDLDFIELELSQPILIHKVSLNVVGSGFWADVPAACRRANAVCAAEPQLPCNVVAVELNAMVQSENFSFDELVEHLRGLSREEVCAKLESWQLDLKDDEAQAHYAKRMEEFNYRPENTTSGWCFGKFCNAALFRERLIHASNDYGFVGKQMFALAALSMLDGRGEMVNLTWDERALLWHVAFTRCCPGMIIKGEALFPDFIIVAGAAASSSRQFHELVQCVGDYPSRYEEHIVQAARSALDRARRSFDDRTTRAATGTIIGTLPLPPDEAEEDEAEEDEAEEGEAEEQDDMEPHEAEDPAEMEHPTEASDPARELAKDMELAVDESRKSWPTPPLSLDGAVLLRLTRMCRNARLQELFNSSHHLAPVRERLAVAGCVMQPDFTAARCMIPISDRSMIDDLKVEVKAEHIIALKEDIPSLEATLKDLNMRGRKRPRVEPRSSAFLELSQQPSQTSAETDADEELEDEDVMLELVSNLSLQTHSDVGMPTRR